MRVPASGPPLLEVEVPRESAPGEVCVVRWLPDGSWTGTCPGYEHRETCKHIDKIRTRVRDCKDVPAAGDLL